jgi:hypothetical protein
MAIKVSDLKNQTGAHEYPFLYCSECDSHISANAGDYFLQPAEHEFYCCGVAMRLMRKRVILEEVNPDGTIKEDDIPTFEEPGVPCNECGAKVGEPCAGPHER